MTAATSPKDEERMGRALEIAALGKPSPNPHVGAVVVNGDKIVGEGFHLAAGKDHAEVIAIETAGAKAKGATLYVTLEPCNHQGRTPRCTDAILKAGIKRVVVGCRDPNPHVEGRGIERLRAEGVTVDLGVRQAEAETVIAPWTKWVTLGLPFVAIKLGLSLDGRIATRTGSSKWVTSPDSRQRVHLLRSQHDAIAVGIGTVLTDDPQLTVRNAPGDSPTRIVFDTKLRIPLSARLVETVSEVPTVVVCSADAAVTNEDDLTSRGVEVLRAPSSAEGRIDVGGALRLLAQRGIVALMVEGGAELAGSFLAGRFADALHAFVAPILLGPRGRPGAVDWAGPDEPANAPRIENPVWEVVGDDAHVYGRIRYPD